MSGPLRKRLGDLLIDAGLITKEQLETTLKSKNRDQKLGDALVQNGYITEQQLITALEQQLGIPHIHLYRQAIDKNLSKLIPVDMAKQRDIVPFKREGQTLYVAMADPMDLYTVEELRLLTGYQIEPAIAAREDIQWAIRQIYGLDDSVEELLTQIPTTDRVAVTDRNDNTSAIAKLVNQILMNAIEQRASDVHIDPHESSIAIRYRIDGVLNTVRTLPKNMQNILTARMKIISNLNITESRLPQDGRVKLDLQGKAVDLRVSTLPTIFGEKIVVRILDLHNTLQSPQQIGFSDQNLKTFLGFIEKPNGIVLITGPTGSGKTATLYAALNYLNTEKVNIITIEDPVEYQLEGINQIQVNPNVGLTFANGLRAILRQDPNIIMVGEIRDSETAEIAVRASLTGHLVLSTIHTNDAVSTITRLIDMGIEPFLIASSLTGVIAQRLVRRVCLHCGEFEPATAREKEIFASHGLEIDRVFRGKGCRRCNMTGYRGRTAIHEILTVDDEARKLIMNNAPTQAIRKYFEAQNMAFLIDDGLMKVKESVTTTEEILRVVAGTSI